MKIPKIRAKDLVTITDLSRDEVLNIFKFTSKLKDDFHKGKKHAYLKNKSLAMVFEKSSTRTRVSFEAGMYQLGGQALFLSSNDIQIGRGEPFSDTAKVLSRYVDGIMIRTDDHNKVVELAREASIPVINGLSDSYHPCQALADVFTVYEREPSLSSMKIAYLGDGNNVANSLLLCCSLMGLNIAIASPKNYMISAIVANRAKALASASGAKIQITSDIDEAVKDANFLYTDVWTSMGQEKEAAKRKKVFAKYRITMDLLKKAAPKCCVMHCLPAHREEEIDADVMESKSSIIFDQAENRMHVQKSIMCALMGKR